MRPEISLGVLPKVTPTFICFYYTFTHLFNFIYTRVFCLHVCAPYVCSTLRGRRRTLCPLELELQMGCEPSCGCQELNPGPLREQPEFLATEPTHNLFF